MEPECLSDKVLDTESSLMPFGMIWEKIMGGGHNGEMYGCDFFAHLQNKKKKK